MSRRVGRAGGRDAGHVINSGGANNMTGTATIGPAVIDVQDIDGICFDCTHTGAAVGSIKIEASNSHVPNTMIGASAPIVAGNWTDITAQCSPAITQPNNNARTQMFALPHTLGVMQAKYIRISYTNSSSTGSLDVWVHGKSLGD